MHGACGMCTGCSVWSLLRRCDVPCNAMRALCMWRQHLICVLFIHCCARPRKEEMPGAGERSRQPFHISMAVGRALRVLALAALALDAKLTDSNAVFNGMISAILRA